MIKIMKGEGKNGDMRVHDVVGSQSDSTLNDYEAKKQQTEQFLGYLEKRREALRKIGREHKLTPIKPELKNKTSNKDVMN